MIFTANSVYSKTQFACLSNDLNYEEKHYENIKLIDILNHFPFLEFYI